MDISRSDLRPRNHSGGGALFDLHGKGGTPLQGHRLIPRGAYRIEGVAARQ